MSGSFVSPETRARVRGLMTPIAVGLGRLGLSPNALTVIGFLIACVAAIAAGLQSWIVAGVLVVFGGVFDLFDGALARATGKVSKLGAFMDSTFDRWGEGVVYLGILWGALELGYSLPVDPHRRGDGLGVHGQLHAGQVGEPGLRPRDRHGQRRARAARDPDRHPDARAARRRHAPAPPGDTGGARRARAIRVGVWSSRSALGLIAVLATITVIQRIVATINQASKQEQG